MKRPETIEDYLGYVGRFRKSRYGMQFRQQFRDTRGTSELAMLVSPSEQEFEDFSKLVQVMSEQEKMNAENLTAQQVQEIAQRADVDSGNANIFINGYVLARQQ